MKNDLISRQAALDIIDSELNGWLTDDERLHLEGVAIGIECLPRIDAVPVVRCKDCKHWDTSWQNDYAPNYHYCLLVDGTRRDDFYCADAERRSDE